MKMNKLILVYASLRGSVGNPERLTALPRQNQLERFHSHALLSKDVWEECSRMTQLRYIYLVDVQVE